MKTARKSIKNKVLKSLLAHSGNQCYFPDCIHPIFNEKGLYVAELCHIEAVSPNGQRYRESQTIEERDSNENLMFFCHRHHKETDVISEYPVSRLKEIKFRHESQFREQTYSAQKNQLEQIQNEIKEFWDDVKYLNENSLPIEIKLEINIHQPDQELLNEIYYSLNRIGELTNCVPNKIFNDAISIGIPNHLTRASTRLKQLEIRLLELKAFQSPSDKFIQKLLAQKREDFRFTAQVTGIL